jgi:hypothetical protein
MFTIFKLTVTTTWTFLLAMSKRKLSTSGPYSSQKQLNLYEKSYKGGSAKDLHLAVFQDAFRWIVESADTASAAATTGNSSTLKVLYPGCHRHLTAALVFANITFVDCDSKVASLFSDPASLEYVETHKLYNEDPRYQFYCYNVNENMPKIHPNEYDLLISLSSGTMVEPCTTYVKSGKHNGGYLLVNDAHSDARSAFVSNKWQLLAYWDDDSRQFRTDRLEQCFQVIAKDAKSSKKRLSSQTENVVNTKPISKEQVQESIAVGTIRKRSFRLLYEPMFFLFRRKE